jgi:transposase-like protein
MLFIATLVLLHTDKVMDGTKTVLTEVGPVPIDVPRDPDGSFEPQIVRRRQLRLSGVEDMVLSLSAKGPTTGEISAHLAEVYGADVSRQTISTIMPLREFHRSSRPGRACRNPSGQ